VDQIGAKQCSPVPWSPKKATLLFAEFPALARIIHEIVVSEHEIGAAERVFAV
jgi:hypothetical protein